eukprot:4856394-Pyramimonas_sp.AAC.2
MLCVSASRLEHMQAVQVTVTSHRCKRPKRGRGRPRPRAYQCCRPSGRPLFARYPMRRERTRRALRFA